MLSLISALTHSLAFISGGITLVIVLFIFVFVYFSLLSIEYSSFSTLTESQTPLPPRESSDSHDKPKLSNDSDSLNLLLTNLFSHFLRYNTLQNFILQRINKFSASTQTGQLDESLRKFYGKFSEDEWLYGASSVLGDIHVHDLSIENGEGLKLGNVEVEFDQEKDGQDGTDQSEVIKIFANFSYSGKISVKTATLVTLSIPSLSTYIAPISIPIILTIVLTHISSRVQLKINAQNELYFGIFPDSLRLDLNVEPEILDKRLKLSLLNAIIKRRVWEQIVIFCGLPKMDYWGKLFDDGDIKDDVSERINDDVDTHEKPSAYLDDLNVDINGKVTLQEATDEETDSIRTFKDSSLYSQAEFDPDRKLSVSETIEKSRSFRESILKATLEYHDPEIPEKTNLINVENPSVQHDRNASVPVPRKSLRNRISSSVLNTLLSTTQTIASSPTTIKLAKTTVSAAASTLEYLGVLEQLDSKNIESNRELFKSQPELNSASTNNAGGSNLRLRNVRKTSSSLSLDVGSGGNNSANSSKRNSVIGIFGLSIETSIPPGAKS
ncbi:hypothetical protein HK098_007937 [Nowakowskiella sp. JEL0407]|nr:hypothetical protein HK098_007937 [Nowakowskiella sp. JEL0407]